jgi:hypothetical protein
MFPGGIGIERREHRMSNRTGLGEQLGCVLGKHFVLHQTLGDRLPGFLGADLRECIQRKAPEHRRPTNCPGDRANDGGFFGAQLTKDLHGSDLQLGPSSLEHADNDLQGIVHGRSNPVSPCYASPLRLFGTNFGARDGRDYDKALPMSLLPRFYGQRIVQALPSAPLEIATRCAVDS